MSDAHGSWYADDGFADLFDLDDEDEDVGSLVDEVDADSPEARQARAATGDDDGVDDLWEGSEGALAPDGAAGTRSPASGDVLAFDDEDVGSLVDEVDDGSPEVRRAQAAISEVDEADEVWAESEDVLVLGANPADGGTSGARSPAGGAVLASGGKNEGDEAGGGVGDEDAPVPLMDLADEFGVRADIVLSTVRAIEARGDAEPVVGDAGTGRTVTTSRGVVRDVLVAAWAADAVRDAMRESETAAAAASAEMTLMALAEELGVRADIALRAVEGLEQRGRGHPIIEEVPDGDVVETRQGPVGDVVVAGWAVDELRGGAAGAGAAASSGSPSTLFGLAADMGMRADAILDAVDALADSSGEDPVLEIVPGGRSVRTRRGVVHDVVLAPWATRSLRGGR